MTIKLGIIGMGYCGRQQLLAAQDVPEIEVAAAADASDAEFPGVRKYRDWRQLLDDPRIDAVSMCLPHFLHAEVALAALHAGKHLLIEKPLAPTLSEAHRLAAAARETSRVTMVEMTHRFYPPIVEGRALIQAGRIGEIFAVEERVIERIAAERCPPWLFERKRSGGGVAITDGIHCLDRIAWVCGQPLRYCHGQAGYSQKLGDVEDTALMQLELSGGAPVSVLLSFQRAGGNELDDELTVYGTRGTLRLWAWRGWRLEHSDGRVEEHSSYRLDQDIYARVRIGMRGALREFAGAITTRRRATPDFGELLGAQEILDQFYAQIHGRAM